jgi:Xaa-Pro aminopeptidase
VAPAGPGNVLTVEPGAYIRPADGVPEAFWNIGIRIEDDALVTDTRLRHPHHRHPQDRGRHRGPDGECLTPAGTRA